MKKRTIGLLLLVLSLSLSGCGGKSDGQKQEQVETQETEQEEQENESDADAEQEEISYGEQEDLSAETGESEAESKAEEFYDPNEAFQNLVSVLDEVIDKEKVYTQEEFEEFVAEIFDKIDPITYDPDLGEDAKKLNAAFNLKGAAIQDYFNNLFYNIFGQFGGCNEMGIKVVGVNGDEIEIEVQYTPFEYE